MVNYSIELSLAAITLVIFLLLYKWHNNPNNTFDLTDALLGEDGKASLYKIGQAAALIISSWAFIVMVQRDKLTEFYFYGYMGVWSGINLAKNLLGKAPDAGTNKS
jgi:hypothetical protein